MPQRCLQERSRRLLKPSSLRHDGQLGHQEERRQVLAQVMAERHQEQRQQVLPRSKLGIRGSNALRGR